VRVLVADDQPEVRSALRLLLEQQPDMIVVGDVADAQQLLERAGSLRPDLVLLDWELPGNADASLPASLRNRCGRVIALSGRPEAESAALRAGADGFVSKGDPPERLLSVLRGHEQGEERSCG